MSAKTQLASVLCATALVYGCGAPQEEIVLLDADNVADEAVESADSETQSLVGASARAGLRMVGSSTVFPFTTAVAENFGAKTEYPTPVIEATGTGGGMNLFCAGLGSATPDMTGASREIRASEVQLCQDNGVTEIVEILIGFDGIVLGNSIDAPAMDISKRDMFLALAAEIPMPLNGAGEPMLDLEGEMLEGQSFADITEFDCSLFVANPYQRWSDIDPSLPSQRIEVFGPPPTSGTRDAFLELGMHLGARRIACMDALYGQNDRQFDQVASRIREDGGWVDSGENDNTIVQTLANTPSAFGLFGYSFLEQNGDRIQATLIDSIEPTYDNIANGTYPVSRSLFVYVKAQHVAVTPGLLAFVEELTSEESWGPFGYLAERGLIALPDTRRADAAMSARRLEPMSAE